MRIRTMAAMAVIPLAVALSACSSGAGSNNGVAGGGGSSKSAASASSTVNARDAQLKYAQCLREHGVDVKDPEPGQPVRITNNNGSLDMNKLQDAQKACQSYMQQAAPEASADDAKAHDAMVKYAECMRQNGIDMPDPTAGGGMQMKGPSGNDAKMQAAQQACMKFLPGAQGGGPVQGGGTGQ